MARKMITISAAATAVGGAGEELKLRVPMGFEQVLWTMIVARNTTTAMTCIELWLEVGAYRSLMEAGNPGAARITVNAGPFAPGEAPSSFIAAFFTAVAGDQLMMFAYGFEDTQAILV